MKTMQHFKSDLLSSFFQQKCVASAEWIEIITTVQ